jgi:hypothetical protein
MRIVVTAIRCDTPECAAEVFMYPTNITLPDGWEVRIEPSGNTHRCPDHAAEAAA